MAIEKFPLPDIGKFQYVIIGFAAVVSMFQYSIQRFSIVALGEPNLEGRDHSAVVGVERSGALGGDTFVMFLWMISVSTAYMVRRSCNVRRAL